MANLFLLDSMTHQSNQKFKETENDIITLQSSRRISPYILNSFFTMHLYEAQIYIAYIMQNLHEFHVDTNLLSNKYQLEVHSKTSYHQ